MKRPYYIIPAIIISFCIVHAQEKKWEERLEASYVKTSGNTSTESAAMKFDGKYTGIKNRYLLKSTLLISKEKGKENANSWLSEFRYERTLSGRLFGFVSSQYIQDRFTGYQYRFYLGPGVGVDVLRNDSHLLKSLLASMYYVDQLASDDQIKNESITAKMIINYAWKIKKDVSLKNHIDYSISFENTDKYFLIVETALEVAMSTHLSIGINYLINYQHDVPAPEFKSTDTSFLTSLILNF